MARIGLGCVLRGPQSAGCVTGSSPRSVTGRGPRVRGLVTIGPAIDPSEFSTAPNVEVVAALPRSEVLRYAAVVVTHGGHGTAVKSLAAGVPVVVLPHGRDQADNAARVVTRTAGVKVKRTARARTIAGAIRTVLADERYGSHAEILGR